MLLVYDKNTKNVTSSMLTSNRAYIEAYVPDAEHKCYICPDNIQLNQTPCLYRIEENQQGNPIAVVKRDMNKLILSCNKELVSPQVYRMSCEETANIRIDFKDKNDVPITPIGTIRLSNSRGRLDTKEIVLTGQSFIEVTWTPPLETIQVSISATLINSDLCIDKDLCNLTIVLI